MTEPSAQNTSPSSSNGASSSRRLAVVTGASAGIGEATAVALAADGWDVVLAARRPEKLEAVAGRIAAEAPDATSHVVQVDVTDRTSVDALAATVHDLGGVDLVVNNAGGARGFDSVLDGDVEDWR